MTPLLPQLSARVPRRAQVSIWIRNVQLGLFSIPQSAALCLADRAAVTSAGIGALFAGFSPAVWSVVGLKAFGGLLVAAVVKYADNILKTYVAALSNPNALSWAPKPHTAQIRRQVCDRDFDRANVPAIACALWHAALHRVRYRCCANRAVGAALQLIMLPAIVPPGFHHRGSQRGGLLLKRTHETSATQLMDRCQIGEAAYTCSPRVATRARRRCCQRRPRRRAARPLSVP